MYYLLQYLNNEENYHHYRDPTPSTKVEVATNILKWLVDQGICGVHTRDQTRVQIAKIETMMKEVSLYLFVCTYLHSHAPMC
jgi:hypothetical protein